MALCDLTREQQISRCSIESAECSEEVYFCQENISCPFNTNLPESKIQTTFVKAIYIKTFHQNFSIIYVNKHQFNDDRYSIKFSIFFQNYLKPRQGFSKYAKERVKVMYNSYI